MGRRAVSAEERAHGRRVGAILAAERRRVDWSAEEVARVAEISSDTVRSLETGRIAVPGFLTVARIASVLSVSLDDLHRQASHEN